MEAGDVQVLLMFCSCDVVSFIALVGRVPLTPFFGSPFEPKLVMGGKPIAGFCPWFGFLKSKFQNCCSKLLMIMSLYVWSLCCGPIVASIDRGPLAQFAGARLELKPAIWGELRHFFCPWCGSLEGRHYRHFGTVFEPKTSILGTLGAHVGTRGVHCGDPGLPKRLRRRPLGVRCCFLSVFGGCWVPLGDQFGVILGTFSGFWVAKWEVWLLTSFADAFWVKNDLSAAALCGENRANTDVLVRVHFSVESPIFEDLGSLFELILGGFGDLWAPFCSFLRVLENNRNFNEF